VIGHHAGVWHYTVGQRRGLRLPGPEPLYVRALDVEANQVVVATAGEAPFGSMIVGGLNWLSRARSEMRCTVRVRYRQAPQGCVASESSGGRLRVVFDVPQRAVAAGQGAVFYLGERVLAGGIIEEAS